MKHYKYIGDLDLLKDQTALGRDIERTQEAHDGIFLQPGFYVQVDKFTHPWSHHWHKTNKQDWEEIPPCDCDELDFSALEFRVVKYMLDKECK